MEMNVIGMKLKHFEKSRASKVNCINHKVPTTCLNLLKSDDERKASVKEYQEQKQALKNDGVGKGFFEKKEKEFDEILKRIERVKNHKLAMAASHGQPSDQAATGEVKRETNLIES